MESVDRPPRRRRRSAGRTTFRAGDRFWTPLRPEEQVTGGGDRMAAWLASRVDGFRHLLPQRITGGMQDQTPAPPLRSDEAAFQALVVEVLERSGFLVWHDHDSRRNEAGLPDIIAVREHRLVWIELKTERGTLRQRQELWGYLLSWLGGNVEYYCLRPSDWETVLAICR
jgi:hypothetical protein